MKARLLVAMLVAVPLFLASPPRTVLAANALPYYFLPWDNGVYHDVWQGNNVGTHTGSQAYAWDFGGDGWLVRAARGGIVSDFRENQPLGGCDPSLKNNVNYVKIDTQDGYETAYLHLAQWSISSHVYRTELVDRYFPLANTDTSGYACGAHLHYQVQYTCQGLCQTVPSSFVDPDVLRHADWSGVPPTLWPYASIKSGNYPQLPRIALVSPASNRFDLFVRDTSNGASHRYQDGNGLHAWENLGGTGLGQPSATSWGPNRIDVFAIGGDGHLWQRYWDGAVWNPVGHWQDLGNGPPSGSGILVGTPSAAAWGVNKISVVARDIKGALMHWYCNVASCGWDSSSPGGWLAADPIAISAAPDTPVHVLVLGNNGRTFHQSWSPATGWTGYDDWGTANNGSAFVSQPTAASWDRSHIDAFNVSADGNLWTKHYDGSTWGAWQLMGNPGSLVFGSAAAVDRFNGVWSVVVRDANGSPWECRWTGANCPWASLGGALTSEPAMISVATNYLDLLVRDTNLGVSHRHFFFSAWDPWESFRGVMP